MFARLAGNNSIFSETGASFIFSSRATQAKTFRPINSDIMTRKTLVILPESIGAQVLPAFYRSVFLVELLMTEGCA